MGGKSGARDAGETILVSAHGIDTQFTVTPDPEDTVGLIVDHLHYVLDGEPAADWCAPEARPGLIQGIPRDGERLDSDGLASIVRAVFGFPCPHELGTDGTCAWCGDVL